MRIKTIITIIIITTLLPLTVLAQLDFDLDSLFNTSNIGSYITVNSVNLIWSVDTYTPYEYEGRKLPVIGSKVIIEAIVNTSGGDAKSLKYSWFLEDIFQRSKSGYGKDGFYFYVQQRPGACHTVKVQIFNEDRSVFEERTIQIPIVEPELVVNSSTISPGKEYSFIAKPYFFSISKLADLTFEWHFSGQEPIISSDYDASILDLTITNKQNNELLEKELWVSVQNKEETRQKASQTINVIIY